MEHIGIDVHKSESQICIVTEQGELIERRVRAQLGVRDQLVQSRTRQINLVRTLLRAEGLRVGSGSAESFEARLARVPLPEWLAAVIAPLRTILAHLTEQIAQVDRTLQQQAREDERAERLRTVPGVGPLTALAFVAVVDHVGRFRDAHQLEALGQAA